MEFRCFVRDNNIVGISQRHGTSFFSFLPQMREELRPKIVDFFNDDIKGQVPVSSYIFDVYISRNRRVWLVDFGLFDSEVSDSILFDWSELVEQDKTTNTNTTNTNEDFPFKVVESAIGVLVPSSRMRHGLPQDMLLDNTGTPMDNLMKQIREQASEELQEDFRNTSISDVQR